MKIEMCESLFYSWLRHLKGCQLVQTNWKPSPKWAIENRVKAEEFMRRADAYFQNKHGYEIFKSNSFSQLISQAESDLVGICFGNEGTQAFSVETAFHEGGLNYGGSEETITRIIKKLARSALCIAGYFNIFQGEIIFASPKIHNAVINDLKACVEELNNLFVENGFDFATRIIANEDFNNEVLLPVLDVSNRVSDTTELFMRSWQLISLYEQKSKYSFNKNKISTNNKSLNEEGIKIDDKNSQMTCSLDDFYIYLTNKKYADNTKNSYVYSVKRVAEWENINIITLAEKIDEILLKYDKGGIYQDRGQIGNATVINALKRFAEFINYFQLNQNK